MKPCDSYAGYINEALRSPMQVTRFPQLYVACYLGLPRCLCGITITYQCYHSFAIGTGAVSRLLALLLDLHWDFPDHFCFAHAIYIKWLPERSQTYPNHPCGAAKRPHKGSLLSLVILRSIFYKLPVHLT